MSICKDCICRKYCGDDDIRRCDRYFRDGSIKTEQTNEEWFCQLPTAEKAEVILKKTTELRLERKWSKRYIEEWLKEKHNGVQQG